MLKKGKVFHGLPKIPVQGPMLKSVIFPIPNRKTWEEDRIWRILNEIEFDGQTYKISAKEG